MIDQKIFDRANAANRLLNDPDFQFIMSEIEADIFSTFRAVNLGDEDTMNAVHQLSHGLKLVGNKLDKYIQTALFEASKREES